MRLDQHPVADGIVAGGSLRRQRQVGLSRLGQAAQPVSMDHGDAGRDEVCIARFKLVAEKLRPSKGGKRG
ncbi:hypothetical protein MesoLj113b_29550 [Mesorhizobium sp. 113-3-3]|nr:hypothetical protein MesoLj113b_29550 [Mesorhizobium sp. 113-3-3]